MKALNLFGALVVALPCMATAAFAQSGAHLGDGSNTTPPAATTPGYNVGTGSAQLGDGSNSKPESPATPGYNVGTAQSLVPPPGMAQSEETPKPSSGK